MDSEILFIEKAIRSAKEVKIINKEKLQDTIALQIQYKKEIFLVMIKKAFGNHYVINVNNPVKL
ncbi:Uncharacterised protein [Serratia fonticola]|uniref:Uncharacterized protein n=1 Tax=Serratia fonticola TaxID=47917 RepID=A0A4U9WIX5_SERFO|nr:Uncharacterised protein [Serratia fonticola]